MAPAPFLAAVLLLAAPAAAQSWLEPTGSFDLDWSGYEGEGDLRLAEDDFPDDFDLRRARIGVKGTLHPRLSYRSTFRIEPDGLETWDLFLDATSPEETFRLRVGRFKEGVGYERMTRPVDVGFLERGPATTALTPNRNQGVQLRTLLPADRGSWTLGLFREIDPVSGSRRDGAFADDLDLSTRVAVNNGAFGEEQLLLQLGVSASLRRPDDGLVAFDHRMLRGARRVVDTGELAADRVQLGSLEFLARRGRWSLESEYLEARVQQSGGGDLRFPGGMVKLRLVPAGEQLHYQSSVARFRADRQPWHLAARVAWVDLTDGGVQGGRLDMNSIGATWWMHPRLALLAEVGQAEVDGETAWYAGVRLHLDF